MTAEFKINASHAAEMAADVHAAMSKYAGNTHGDGMADKRPARPCPSQQPGRTTEASRQHRAEIDTDVHGCVPGEGRKMRHPGMSGGDRQKTGRRGAERK